MIIAEGPNEYRLITQNDHGDLAGQFAAHWGNDKFARLNPYPSMVLAAEAHDNGWWHWDINPSVDEAGVPLAFSRTPREQRSGFYGKGIDDVVEKDLYAGLMVSMHGVGLPQQRYGSMPSMSKRVDEYSLGFIKEREPLHKTMMEQVARLEQYAGMNSSEQIWFNYRMMQVFDRLSLFFCANFDITTVPASGAHAQGKAYYGPAITPTPVRFGAPDSEVLFGAPIAARAHRRTLPVRQVSSASRGEGTADSAHRLREPGTVSGSVWQSAAQVFEFTLAAH